MFRKSPLTVTGVDSAVITNTYDVLNRRKSIDDPDKGLWQTTFNALGESVREVAPDYITTFSYFDSAGRQTSRLVRTNNSTYAPVIDTSTWIYIGALLDELNNSNSTTIFTYDGFGRPASKTVTLDGVNFVSSTTYDQYGRLFQQFDPSGGHRGLAYSYKNGVIEKIYETRGSSSGQSTEYFKLLSVDARGNTATSVQGNGVITTKVYDPASGFLKSIDTSGTSTIQSLDYEFDGLGNLRARRDGNQYISGQYLNEVFDYDALNRLTSTKLNGQTTLSMSYFDNGNIQSKSDLSGSFGYGNASSFCTNNFAGPHAVTSRGTKNYCYDDRGNQTHAYNYGHEIRAIQYGHFDKPTSITTSTGSTAFEYDANDSRIKRTDTVSGSTETTYYLDGLEYLKDAQGNVTYKRYLGGFAIQDVTTSSETIQYVHNDHLGSMDAYTNSSGAITTKISFSPFGERRVSSGWQGNLTSSALLSLTDVSKRGYTGHEHIEHAGIIHMNGRIYDDELGRFAQADPYIQEVKNSQNYNRYSYVLNNPLSYTDPTGYNYQEINDNQHKAMQEEQARSEQQGGGTESSDYNGNQNNDKKLESSSSQSDSATSQDGTAESENWVSRYVDEAKMFGDWLVNHSVEQLKEEGGLSGSIWGFLAEDGIKAYNEISEGNYTGALKNGALAIFKPAKIVEKFDVISKSGTEVVQRWMSKAELKATKETGLLRGGRDGTHFVTDAANSDPLRARQRLALDNTPEVRVTMEVPRGQFTKPSRVEENFSMPGGGMERTATGRIPVNIKSIDK